jgi:hypothetical protein
MQPKPIIQPQIVKEFFNGKEKECILVKIEGDEYTACDAASRHFFASKKKGEYGKGFLNTLSDPCKTERVGLLGQMAFGKVVDEPVDLMYREGGDDQDNLICERFKVDIKCASRNYGANLIQKKTEFGKEMKNDNHIYVGSFMHSENVKEKIAEITLVGYFMKKDFTDEKIAPARRGSHINYEFLFEEMHPIKHLIRRMKNTKNKKKDK